MSAGFKVADEVFWGTNGAVEAYLDALAAVADVYFGPGDLLTTSFRDERDGFYLGKIVCLDEWVRDAASRSRLLRLLDAATEKLLDEGVLTDYGREWVRTVVKELRTRIDRGTRTSEDALNRQIVTVPDEPTSHSEKS